MNSNAVAGAALVVSIVSATISLLSWQGSEDNHEQNLSVVKARMLLDHHAVGYRTFEVWSEASEALGGLECPPGWSEPSSMFGQLVSEKQQLTEEMMAHNRGLELNLAWESFVEKYVADVQKLRMTAYHLHNLKDAALDHRPKCETAMERYMSKHN